MGICFHRYMKLILYKKLKITIRIELPIQNRLIVLIVITF